MSFVYHFSPYAMSSAKYDKCIAQLDAAGAGNPPGRLHHVTYGPPDALQVFDVWDSEQSFASFGEVLVPILQKLGVDAGRPEVSPVHSMIRGS
jgi:hypothetical protein